MNVDAGEFVKECTHDLSPGFPVWGFMDDSTVPCGCRMLHRIDWMRYDDMSWSIQQLAGQSDALGVVT